MALARCFLGIGMLLSILARSADVARGAAFVVRLTLLLFLGPILSGPTAYVILDIFGEAGYIVYTSLYPAALGTACTGLGYFFKRGDLSWIG